MTLSEAAAMVDMDYIFVEKYPEIKKLFGTDTTLKYKISALVIFNIVTSYFVAQVFNLSYFWTTVLAYALGGVVNHMLVLAIHETSHNLVFGNSYPLTNRFFGMWVNLPVIFPMSISFKKYHLEHHRYLGIDTIDTDIPTEWEGKMFYNPFTKMIWMILQPAFYALRPFLVRPKPPTKLEILNTVIQMTFNILLYYFVGFKAVYYLMIGTLLSMGLHPFGAHFIAEHYVFEKGYETYSYYGPWNYLSWNVGYHVEHHDFPYIPGSRLPEVKRIASDFYDDLPQHDSWFSVIWEFLFNPDCGPYGRIKRDYKMLGIETKVRPTPNGPALSKPDIPGSMELRRRDLSSE